MSSSAKPLPIQTYAQWRFGDHISMNGCIGGGSTNDQLREYNGRGQSFIFQQGFGDASHPPERIDMVYVTQLGNVGRIYPASPADGAFLGRGQGNRVGSWGPSTPGAGQQAQPPPPPQSQSQAGAPRRLTDAAAAVRNRWASVNPNSAQGHGARPTPHGQGVPPPSQALHQQSRPMPPPPSTYGGGSGQGPHPPYNSPPPQAPQRPSARQNSTGGPAPAATPQPSHSSNVSPTSMAGNYGSPPTQTQTPAYPAPQPPSTYPAQAPSTQPGYQPAHGMGLVQPENPSRHTYTISYAAPGSTMVQGDRSAAEIVELLQQHFARLNPRQ